MLVRAAPGATGGKNSTDRFIKSGCESRLATQTARDARRNNGASAGLLWSLIPASHRSTACCMPSQLSGVPPTALEIRIAISAVTAFYSGSSCETVCRLTMSRFASSVWVQPSSGNTSSRSTAPGCVGLRSGFRRDFISGSPLNSHLRRLDRQIQT